MSQTNKWQKNNHKVQHTRNLWRWKWKCHRIKRGGGELPTLWNRCAGAHTAPLRSCIRNLAQFDSLCLMAVTIIQNDILVFTVQGPKLRLTGRQCNQICRIDNQNFKTGRKQVTNPLSPQYLKSYGKRSFLKRKHKAPMDNCSNTK